MEERLLVTEAMLRLSKGYPQRLFRLVDEVC
jgi:hypothetical protein